MASSFFKILLDPTSDQLPLPPRFVSMHMKNKIPQGPMMLCASGGHSWRVKFKKIDDGYVFTNGWDKVVRDIPLDFGDFLVFRLLDQSTFRMTIFKPNGCELPLPKKEVASQIECIVIDDDDDVEEEKGNGQVNEVVKRKRGRPARQPQPSKMERPAKQPHPSGKAEEKVNNEEVNGDDENNEDGDPSCTLIITKSLTSKLRFPVEFSGLVGIDGEGDIKMKNLDGDEWLMGLRMEERNRRTTRYFLRTGWRDFQRVNNICVGDTCQFKFIRSEGKLLAKVTKKNPCGEIPLAEVVTRKRGRPPLSSNKTPVTEVVIKRKRGRPPKQPQPSSKIPVMGVVKVKIEGATGS